MIVGEGAGASLHTANKNENDCDSTVTRWSRDDSATGGGPGLSDAMVLFAAMTGSHRMLHGRL